MAELKFPARQRCKACRTTLAPRATDPVYKGLYCSPKCAGIAAPAARAQDAPRECRTQRDGQWAFKRRYRSEEEIPDKIRQDPSTSWYWCSHCGHIHIGHTRMGAAEQFVMTLDRASIAEVLLKLRGQATHKQIAAAAGVRPIRLKEWEDPGHDAPSLDALLAVLRVYRVRVGFSLPVSRR